MRIPELWRMSGRAGGLPGSPVGRPERPRVTLADRVAGLAGLAGRIVWHAGSLMGSLDARITGTAEEPTRARVAIVAGTASGAWLALCGLAWLVARRWDR